MARLMASGARCDAARIFRSAVLDRHLGTIASTLGDVLTTTFIIVIVAIFILLEGSALPDKIRQVDGLSFETWTRLRQIVAHVRRYMFLKTVMSLLTGALVALWLFAVGVEFPILLGVLAFALNYIPTIGSIVAAIPCISLRSSSSASARPRSPRSPTS